VLADLGSGTTCTLPGYQPQLVGRFVAVVALRIGVSIPLLNVLHPCSHRRTTRGCPCCARDSSIKRVASAGSKMTHRPPPSSTSTNSPDIFVYPARRAAPVIAGAGGRQFSNSDPCRRPEFRGSTYPSSHCLNPVHQAWLLQGRKSFPPMYQHQWRVFHIFAPKIKFNPFRNKYSFSYSISCILRTGHTAQIYFIFFKTYFVAIVTDNAKDPSIVVFQIGTVVLVVLHGAVT
jgi:hypothetical protein